MAKVRNNIFVRGLSGSLGEQFVVKQDKAGRTIVSVAPTFNENRTYSEAQLEWQDKFRDASVYATGAKENAEYVERAAGTALSSYNVAMADFFNEPEIKEVDTKAWSQGAGQTIRIQVVDDVKVAQVNVAITDATGEVYEEGAAVQAEGAWWNYITTATAESGARIVVTARDMPGNTVQSTWND